MDFNYTLKYRTFDDLLNDVSIDFTSFFLYGSIEPQQLIKVAKKVTYDLGLRINMTKEVILDVEHGRVKLPEDFYVFNFGLVCGEYNVNVGYDIGGTTIAEIPYVEVPATVNTCAAPTVNCSSCNCSPCNMSTACTNNNACSELPLGYDPQNPFGNTCVQPRVFFNCKNEAY